MAEKTALATGPISSPLPLVSSPWLDGSLEWREAEGRGVLVSVWEENRGCERHDILSWPQILQNLTLWKNFACRSLSKHEKPVSRMFTMCHPSLLRLPMPANKLHTYF